MPRVSARIGVTALVLIALWPLSAAKAFGLNLGPLHARLPIAGVHRHNHVARAEPTAPTAPDVPVGSGSPTLLYPILVWPSLYDDIFWPKDSSSWPFSYQGIFDQAFGKYSPDRTANLCPYRDTSGAVVMRIARETAPTAAQKPALQKLATALGQANGYLMKSCPNEIPAQPVARLKLMERQIDATLMALDIVRPALQAFARSLNDKQRARLDGPASATGVASSCKPTAASASGLLARLEQSVQPTDSQQEAFAAVEDAFTRAAADLAFDCSHSAPPTALARLQAAQARLDALWRAILTIEVALANFQKGLTDQQNERLNALQIAAR
jgi:LTXXQ motif family protein